MNKKEFLDELRKELKKNNVSDIEEIIEEYDNHFNYKLEEGRTEEEIAKKLSPPQEIAKEFMENKPTNTKSDKSIKILGITLLSIPSIMLYILLWGCVILIACTSLATLLVGICLITTLIPESIIPNIAYGTSLFLGISFLGLSILCAIATYYLNCYVVQWSKVYCR